MTGRDDGTVTVAAVDDHPAVLAGLRAEMTLIDSRMRFVSTAGSVTQLLAAPPVADVVLLDIRLNDGSTPRDNVLRLVAAGAQVLVYTEGSRRSEMADAVRAGALGVLRKDQPVHTVVEAVRAVAAGEITETPELAQLLEGSTVLRPHLSEREAEVLTLYAAGMPAKSVARRVGVTPDTAKEYLKRVRAKYASIDRVASTRTELYLRAVEDGFLEPPEGRGAP